VVRICAARRDKEKKPGIKKDPGIPHSPLARRECSTTTEAWRTELSRTKHRNGRRGRNHHKRGDYKDKMTGVWKIFSFGTDKLPIHTTW